MPGWQHESQLTIQLPFPDDLARRCAQATVILVVLAMIVVLPWLVITIYFGVEGNDPTSLISSITAKIPGMIEGLFDPRDDEEVHHEQAGKPPLVSARNTENRLLTRERIPIDRQARIETDEEGLRKVQE